jgi:hypothetical protein
MYYPIINHPLPYKPCSKPPTSIYIYINHWLSLSTTINQIRYPQYLPENHQASSLALAATRCCASISGSTLKRRRAPGHRWVWEFPRENIEKKWWKKPWKPVENLWETGKPMKTHGFCREMIHKWWDFISFSTNLWQCLQCLQEGRSQAHQNAGHPSGPIRQSRHV